MKLQAITRLKAEFKKVVEALQKTSALHHTNPSINKPSVMAEKDLSLGGEAHIFAIKELDGISESSYLANIKVENKLLGL